MKSIKFLLLSFFTILIIVVIYLKTSNTTLIAGEEVYIGNPWRELSKQEDIKFEKFIMHNELYKYEKVLWKDIENGAFIVACLNDNKNWEYKHAIPSIDELMILSDEIIAEIDPPK